MLNRNFPIAPPELFYVSIFMCYSVLQDKILKKNINIYIKK